MLAKGMLSIAHVLLTFVVSYGFVRSLIRLYKEKSYMYFGVVLICALLFCILTVRAYLDENELGNILVMFQ